MHGWNRWIALLAGVFLLTPLAPAAAVETPVVLTIVDKASVAYPLLDPDEHSHDVGFWMSRNANLTIAVRDQEDKVVRVLLDRVSTRSGSHGRAVWDLADDDGAPAPEGVYELRLTAVDSSGNVDSKSVLLGIDRRARPTLGGVAPGPVAGTIHPTLAPPADLGVTEVGFQLFDDPDDDPCAYATVGPPAGGVFTGDLDTTTCPGGVNRLRGSFSWIDPLGRPAAGYTEIIDVSLTDTGAPVITAPTVTSRPTLTDSATYQELTYDFEILDASYVASAQLWVTDSAGRVVLPEVQLGSTPSVRVAGTWRWRPADSTGRMLPAGLYTVHFQAADRLGNRGTTEHTKLLLDPLVPGTLAVAPVAGQPHRYLATVTTRSDIEVGSVGFLPWRGESTHEPGTTTWSRVIDLSHYGTRPYALSAGIAWQAPGGFPSGYFTTPSITLTGVDDNPPVVHVPADRRMVLRDPTTYLSDQLVYSVSDATGIGSCRYWVTGPTGATVVAQRPFEACGGFSSTLTWNGTNDAGALQPSGVYTVHTRVSDLQGHTTEGAPVAITLDGRVPGTLAVTPDPADPDVFHATLTPGGGGVRVNEVYVDTTPATRDPDTGLWHARVDLSARPHVTSLSANITWDAEPWGNSARFNTPPIAVRRVDTRPPVVTPGIDRTLYLTRPDAFDPVTIWFGVDEDYPGASGTYWITTTSGAVVRPAEAFDDAIDSSADFSWDGTDARGALLPAGTYVAHARITDRAGHSAEATNLVFLNRTVPGDLTGPFDGGPLSGTVYFEYTPTAEPGMTLDMAWVQFADGGYFEFHNASADGIWRTTFDVDQLAPGAIEYVVGTRWNDPEYGTHYYYGSSRTMQIAAREAPEPPAVTVEGVDRAVDVRWQFTQRNATGFRLEWSRSDGTGGWSGIDVAPDARRHVITGLAPLTSYTVRVRAMSTAGPSNWATAVAQTPGGTGPVDPPVDPPAELPVHPTAPAPALPARVLVSAVALERAAAISWQPAATGAGAPTSYVVQVRRPRSGWATVKVVGAGRSSVKIRGLRPGVVHRVRVVSRNDAGQARSAVVRVRPFR